MDTADVKVTYILHEGVAQVTFSRKLDVESEFGKTFSEVCEKGNLYEYTCEPREVVLRLYSGHEIVLYSDRKVISIRKEQSA